MLIKQYFHIKRWKYGILKIISIFFILMVNQVHAADREFQLKAAFIYNITRMVEWSSEDKDLPLVLCFFGEHKFGDTLQSFKNKTVGNRSLRVHKAIPFEEITQCNILFISDGEKAVLDEILPEIENLPILTIGDIEDFAKNGGIINLVSRGERIKIYINLKMAKKSNIKISSKLLSLAVIIDR